MIKLLTTPDPGVTFLLLEAGAHAEAMFENKLTALKLNPQQAGILRILAANPGMTQHALAKQLGILPSRLVSLLDELETKKFLKRQTKAADRRAHELFLTMAGKRCMRHIGEIARSVEMELLAALPDGQREALRDFLGRIVARAKAIASARASF